MLTSVSLSAVQRVGLDIGTVSQTTTVSKYYCDAKGQIDDPLKTSPQSKNLFYYKEMDIPDDMLLMHKGKSDQLPPSLCFTNDLLLGEALCKQYFFPGIRNITQNENPGLPLKDFGL